MYNEFFGSNEANYQEFHVYKYCIKGRGAFHPSRVYRNALLDEEALDINKSHRPDERS
jgi:hypothetical protein